MPVPSASAAAARCRALVLADDGDLDAARASIKIALSEHARLHEPFELARTYLAQGSIERRANGRPKHAKRSGKPKPSSPSWAPGCGSSERSVSSPALG